VGGAPPGGRRAGERDGAVLHDHAASGRDPRGVHAALALQPEPARQHDRLARRPVGSPQLRPAHRLQLPQAEARLRAAPDRGAHRPGPRHLPAAHPVESARLDGHPRLAARDPDRSVADLHPAALPRRLRAGGAPELRRVIVAYGNTIAMEPTLEQSLARIFAGARNRRRSPPGPRPAHRRPPRPRGRGPAGVEAWTRSKRRSDGGTGRRTASSKSGWRTPSARFAADRAPAAEPRARVPSARGHRRRGPPGTAPAPTRGRHPQVRARRSKETPSPTKTMLAVQAARSGGRRSARAKASAE